MKEFIVSVNSIEEGKKLLASGVDEVVFSVEGLSFNALQKVTLEELKEIPSFSIFVNRFFFPDDSELGKKQFEEAVLLQPKAIYFQDPIVLTWAKEFNCLAKCIYRPETLVTNANDALWWKERGLKAVSLSPLVTLEETETMLNTVPDSECTIHGHLVMSFSKRLLLSAYANTNGLASLQNKQTLTIQELQREGHMPIYEDEAGTLVYTDYIFESFEEIKDLEAAGASRFFINGEFLPWQHLADSISLYKKILEGETVEVEPFHQRYEEVFHSGYYREKTIK